MSASSIYIKLNFLKGKINIYIYPRDQATVQLYPKARFCSIKINANPPSVVRKHHKPTDHILNTKFPLAALPPWYQILSRMLEIISIFERDFYTSSLVCLLCFELTISWADLRPHILLGSSHHWANLYHNLVNTTDWPHDWLDFNSFIQAFNILQWLSYT